MTTGKQVRLSIEAKQLLDRAQIEMSHKQGRILSLSEVITQLLEPKERINHVKRKPGRPRKVKPASD